MIYNVFKLQVRVQMISFLDNIVICAIDSMIIKDNNSINIIFNKPIKYMIND